MNFKIGYHLSQIDLANEDFVRWLLSKFGRFIRSLAWNEIRLTTRDMLVQWGYGGFINKRLFVFLFNFLFFIFF